MGMPLWELIVNLAETILFYFYISSMLSPTKKKIIIKSCYLFFLFSSISVLNYFEISSILTVLLALAGHVFFSILFFENNMHEKIFYGSLFSVICIFSEFIPFLVLTRFSDNTSLDLLANGRLRLLSTSSYLFLIVIFILIVRFLFGKESSWKLKDKLMYIASCLSGIFVCHFILLTTIQANQEGSDSLANSLTLINIAFLILFLSLVIYIYKLSVSNHRISILMEQQKQLELEEQQYHTLLESTEHLRTIKHDMEIHLQNIHKLSMENNLVALNNYVSDYIDSIKSAHSLITTGNTAIDCILSIKISEASSLGIDADYSVLLPASFNMDMIALASLLGNLWNNAIDACKQMMTSDTSEHPFILFYMKPFQDMTIIHIENSFDGILISSSKSTFSSRKDSIEHGVGLKRIKEIVDSEAGIMQITTDNNIFAVHIIIPQEDTLNDNNNT